MSAIDLNAIEQKNKTMQIKFGTIFLLINCFALISNLWSYYYDAVEFKYFFFEPTVFVLLVCTPLFIITIVIIRQWTRALQVLLVFMYGLIGLYDNMEMMWGWSLIFISILLADEYDFLTSTKPQKKDIKGVCIMLACTSLVIIASFIANGKRNQIKVANIFSGGFFFIMFAYLFLFRSEESRKRLDNVQVRNQELERQNCELQRKLDELTDERLGTASIKTKIKNSKHPQFSAQEQKVLILFCESHGSKTNKEIAHQVSLSEMAVNTAMHRCMVKVNARSRTELFTKLMQG